MLELINNYKDMSYGHFFQASAILIILRVNHKRNWIFLNKFFSPCAQKRLALNRILLFIVTFREDAGKIKKCVCQGFRN